MTIIQAPLRSGLRRGSGVKTALRSALMGAVVGLFLLHSVQCAAGPITGRKARQVHRSSGNPAFISSTVTLTITGVNSNGSVNLSVSTTGNVGSVTPTSTGVTSSDGPPQTLTVAAGTTSGGITVRDAAGKVLRNKTVSFWSDFE